jgi:hypothetical protein
MAKSNPDVHELEGWEIKPNYLIFAIGYSIKKQQNLE